MAKQPNWNRQLILALVLAALGGTAYWLQFKQKPKQEAEEEQSKRVFHLKDKQIATISLVSKDHHVSFECASMAQQLCKPGDNSSWNISSPLKTTADGSSVNSLVSTLNSLDSLDTIDLSPETAEKKQALLKEYGLDSAARSSAETQKVVITAKGGTMTLYLGQTHPVGESIFGIVGEVTGGGADTAGKADENHALLIPKYFTSNLSKELSHWREKKIVVLATHDVQSFDLSGGKDSFSGELKEGQWILHTKNGDARGDAENIDALLSSVSYLTARDFVSDDKSNAKAKTALKDVRKALTLTIRKRNSEAKPGDKAAQTAEPVPLIITLYRKTEPLSQQKGSKPKANIAAGKVYVTVSGQDPLYEIDPSSVDKLDQAAVDLRLKRFLTSIEQFTAKSLSFSGKPVGGSIDLQSIDSTWMRMPGKKEIDGSKVVSLINKLTGDRIQKFLPISQVPGGVPAADDALKLVYGDEKEPAKRQYLFWKKDAGFYAKDLLSKRPEVFQVDPQIEDAFPWSGNFFDHGSHGSKPAPNAKK